jgi:hypothetical protein
MLTNEGVRQFAPLNAADRSDAYASGAVQALVRVEKDGKDLLFDGHSYSKHEPALIASGWTVVEDNRVQAQNLPTAAY